MWEAMSWQTLGAVAFGAVIGWYLYFINRYRKNDVSIGDITTVIAAIGGAAVLSIYKEPKIFGAYGIGLAIGFFGYLFILIYLVNSSKQFTSDYFIDGRRPNPPEGWGYGADAQQPVRPMLVPPETSVGEIQILRESLSLSNSERVAKAKALLAVGAVFPRGCSEFVCTVLGIPYRQANDLLGINPPSVGVGPTYADLKPGDIAGWISTTGSGHVAVYVGEAPDAVFIDVREPGAKPRSKNGYYNHEVFKAPL